MPIAQEEAGPAPITEGVAEGIAEEISEEMPVAAATRAAASAPRPARSSSSRWLLVRQQLRTKVERLGIEKTEVALAFPLDGGVSPLPPLEVCAYLPLRTYGLRFLLQADFVVPSSRESVDSSSEWNQWIRDEVPALFLSAAGELLGRAAAAAERGALDECVRLVNVLLECCPLPGHVTECVTRRRLRTIPADCARPDLTRAPAAVNDSRRSIDSRAAQLLCAARAACLPAASHLPVPPDARVGLRTPCRRCAALVD